ncbi:galactokinase [Chryseolinea sp. H1M3-3]|uniref:galactokinase n=1 Tax=Chryseolinea sp. H1M3-3 TaxID=3034144 RepID=UPI0023ED3EC9|nr:galactokinase [Chryseolinea sp. H1M3-3]
MEKEQFSPKSVYRKFLELFDTQPILARSPGRINLIGEHTDYNEGFVMPAAINRDIVVAIDFSMDDHSTLFSVKNNEFFSFHTSDPARVKSPLWANYLLGVVRKIIDQGHAVKSFNCVVDGDVPTGAGLSSSAALECSFAFALDQLHQFNIPRQQLIFIAQWAEHNYAGVKCGIMDQFSSMMGLEGKAFVLDCRSLEFRYFPVNLNNSAIVLCDSMVKHSLASSAYNTRRMECEQGVKILRDHYPEVHSLRDATLQMVESQKAALPGKVYDRCTYVVQENQRVLDASKDLEKGDLAAFGKKMYATHEGLSRLYEVSCEELDFLVDEAKRIDGVLGARMMGGGFGGCTINFVIKDQVKNFINSMSGAYEKQFNVKMNTYIVSIKDGTGIIKI